MSLPQIVYNGKTIVFPFYVYRVQYDFLRSVLQNMSASKIAEVLNVASDLKVSLAFRWLRNADPTEAALKRNLYQWYEWAAQGKAWQMALDGSKTANTTLSSGANAGDTSVVVASAAGIVAGDQCVLRNAAQLELVKASSVSGTTVNLTESLNFGFAAGARFRHELFWPGRMVSVEKHVVQEKPPLHWDAEFDFMEDMN